MGKNPDQAATKDAASTRSATPVDLSAVQGPGHWWEQAVDFMGFGKRRALVAYTLLVVSAAVLTYAALASRQAAFLVRHTIEVRETTRQMLNLLGDAETGQRGFLLTRDATYLEPYNATLPAIEAVMGQLRTLIADNPSQLARFNRLPTLVEAKLAELTQTIALARAGRDDEAIAIMRSGTGRAQMDTIRAVIGEMLAAEDRLLESREGAWRTLGATLLFSILACLVAALTYGLMQLRLPIGAVQPTGSIDITTEAWPLAESWPRIIGIVAIALGSIVLLGWIFDIRLLKSILPGGTSMKANTAICFILAGVALLTVRAGRARIATVCAGAIALIGAATLLEYLLGRGIGIDQLLFQDPEGTYPGRMAPATAMALLGLGVAPLLPARATSVRLALGVGILAASLFAILGHLYDVEALYRIGPYTGVAAHTAIGIALLASVHLVEGMASPDARWARALRTPAAWLTAAVIGIIVLIGSATSHVITGGLLEPAPALAIATLVSLPLIGSVLWGSIDALETARQRVAASEHRFRLLVEDAPNAMLMADAQGHITEVNAQTEKLFGYRRDELLGKSVEMLVPESARAPHPALRAGYFGAPSVRPMGAGRDLFGVRKDGSEVPIEIGLNPLSIGAETFVLAAIIDITQRKRVQESQQLIIRELQHRTQNLFAVFQAIASRTVDESKTAAEIKYVLNGRLQALARAYSMLADAAWEGISLAEILDRQFAGFSKRLMVSGCEIVVRPTAAQQFALIIHELATNALKYGAMSAPEGHVSIEGRIERLDGDGRFSFLWKERGGPIVSPPTRKGFGSVILLDSAQQFGSVTVNYAPEGLTYELEVSLSAIEASANRAKRESGVPFNAARAGL